MLKLVSKISIALFSLVICICLAKLEAESGKYGGAIPSQLGGKWTGATIGKKRPGKNLIRPLFFFSWTGAESNR